MECTDSSIEHKSKTLHVIITYSPPDTSTLSFAEKLVYPMEINVNSCGYLIIMGAINIHMNDGADNDTIPMNNLLHSFNLINNVLVPTLTLQNPLDVVLTDKGYTGISQVKSGTLFSDHHLIT